eukprot:4350761-Prymnesium_polylepis.1
MRWTVRSWAALRLCLRSLLTAKMVSQPPFMIALRSALHSCRRACDRGGNLLLYEISDFAA